MSLSTKYAMKKKMAKGGEAQHHSPAGGSKDRLAGSNRVRREEHVKGVHKPDNVYMPGSSKAGYNARAGHEGQVFNEQAKGEHKKVISEMQSMPKPKLMAEGGMAEHDEDADMIARIMHKRKMYSKGGEVANDTPPIADEMPADYDDLALRDDLEFHETGANSGDELGDAAEDHDRHDIISRIMKSRSKKDKMPRPA